MIKNLDKYLKNLKPKYDDDVIDRCNYLLTNTILFLCAITVAAKQYVGEPLQCWVPAEFKGGWEQYIENYCFVENTYYVPIEEGVPEKYDERERKQLQYYQWVPFILIFQALLFMIPRMIWKMLNWHTGLNITGFAQAAFETERNGSKRILKSQEKLSKNADLICNHVDYAFNFNRGRMKAENHKWLLSGFWSVYVTNLYLFCKALNLLNISIQFVILNRFLGPQYYFWGIGVLNDLIHGRQWSDSGHFPRVTLCDVNIREIGNTNRKTVQCVLMINMFNEKIFIGIWFWLVAIGILTFINLVYWIFISFSSRSAQHFVTSYLRYKNIKYKDESEIEEFIDCILLKDGITVLRLISDNAGEMIAAEMIAKFWNIYKSESTEAAMDKSLDDQSASSKMNFSKTNIA